MKIPTLTMTPTILLPLLVALVMISGGCSNQAEEEMKKVAAERSMVEKNLATFDTLDFTIFTNQQWTRLHESHAKDIKVHWPDGHVTTGIDVHIEDLKAMFVYAPDTRIKQHPLRFGSGNYTAVTGIFEGTFTKPIPMGNGSFVQPTGKSFSLPMATIGIWDNGVMTEEYLFWDNQAYLKQIGLAK